MPEPASEIIQERVWIDGPRRLAGELAYPMCDAPRMTALLLNPHPYMGGSMHNNVIAHLHLALARAGAATLRFDYSGVGESAGQPIDVARSMAEFWATNHAPADELMIDDAIAARDWMRAHATGPLHLVGYSFGSHVAVRLLTDDAASLTMISPTITHHAFEPGFARGVPTLVVVSDNDFATPSDRFNSWLASVGAGECVQTRCFAGAQHFFLDQEAGVATCVTQFVGLAGAGISEARK